MPKGEIVGMFAGRGVLVIDGKNNNEVGMFTDRRKNMLVIDGKNNNDDATSMAQEQQRYVDRVTGRVCMARTTVKTQKRKLEKRSKLRRDNALRFPEVQPRTKRRTRRTSKGRRTFDT
jgi:hypothetical protein